VKGYTAAVQRTNDTNIRARELLKNGNPTLSRWLWTILSCGWHLLKLREFQHHPSNPQADDFSSISPKTIHSILLELKTSSQHPSLLKTKETKPRTPFSLSMRRKEFAVKISI
jgi:hypothetical protein